MATHQKKHIKSINPRQLIICNENKGEYYGQIIEAQCSSRFLVKIVKSNLIISSKIAGRIIKGPNKQRIFKDDFVLLQTSYWNILLYFPAASGFIVVLFLESKRAPFDHSETESEVVAGYSTEYNGPMLLMFFLAEYLHLIIAAIHFSLFFIGGWLSIELFSLLTPVFSSYHEVNSINVI